MASNFSLRLVNDVNELDRLSEAVEEFGHIHQLPPKVVFEINLALDEIITNTISYGYTDPAEHTIEIHLTASSDHVKIVIRDDGIPFNPLDIMPPDLTVPVDERTVGGLGFHFVKTVMNQIQYRRENDCNYLILYKTLA